ncbi:MAG TPA: hypothetical protein DHV62_09370 [Elusimicrobia bacterium]|nr:hypothetical protein [Elusimicrobiota bacterium]
MKWVLKMKKKELLIEDVYSTRDLFESSAIALFQKPIKLELAGDYFLFVFEKEPAEKIANQYWTGELEGNIRAYANSIKAMKDWLFSKKREIEKRNGRDY